VKKVAIVRSDRARGARGAAAVEFALVLLPLMLIVFGIIDYGLYFNNSVSVRQGVREVARQIVVANYSTPAACATGTQVERLVCKSNLEVGALAGTAYSKIIVPTTWARGSAVIVCSQVKNTGTTGFVPLPADGYVRSRVQMSIEADPIDAPAPTGSTASDPLPAGGSWSWCS
jgi:Flp pilus assembly protein TadG